MALVSTCLMGVKKLAAFRFNRAQLLFQELNLYGPLDGFNFTTMYANIFTLDDIQTIRSST